MSVEVSVTIGRNRLVSAGACGEGVNSSLLVTYFEDLVQATGSAKLLKELVLHLAMQGRLSDSQTESVEPLRLEIGRARDRLAKSGVRVRDLQPVEDRDAPWTLPTGWAWVRLGELGGFLGGGTPSKSNSSFWAGPLPWVSPKDMKQPYIDDAEDHISLAAVAESAAKLIPKGSVLCVVRGMILAHSFPVALTRREVAINQDMKALVLGVPAVGEFVLRACQEARGRVLASVERSSHGTCRLDGEVVENLLIPLPPVAEQKRIVAKVDQLMALCDHLEARQAKKREVGSRLTKSALHALTTAEGPEEFDLAWKRVVHNFDVLIDRSEKVAELRGAILDLAVRGRLGRSPTAARTDGPFAIPEHWEWWRGDQTFSFITSGSRGWAAYYSSDGPIFLRIGNLDYETTDLDLQETQRVRPPENAEGIRTRVRPGDILVSITGDTGMVGLVPEDLGEAYINQHIALCRPDDGVVPAFVARALTAPSLLGRLQSAQRGIKNSLGLDDIRSMPIPMPPPEEQRAILRRVDQMLRWSDELEARLGRVEERASKLLDALMRDLATSPL